ncbi:MAG: carboxymuconolactone decarboxylase family protein [Desulfomonile sp.]|jgi:4-carboxymuconolactone decarboxylase
MYLPDILKSFIEKHGEIADAYRESGKLCSDAGPLDTKTQHLLQLGISVGSGSKGGVRSHARRAMEAGATEGEVIHTVLLATPIIGFPAMIAAYGWISEVLSAVESAEVNLA